MAPPRRQEFENGTAFRCTLCGVIKSKAEFSPSTCTASGRQSRCRSCYNAVARERYTPEKARVKTAKYKAAFAAYSAQWKAENLDRVRDYEGRRRVTKRRAAAGAVSALVLLEMDDGVCGICGEDVDPLAFHVDHVIPLSRGGEHSYANTQVAHPSCNLSKGVSLVC